MSEEGRFALSGANESFELTGVSKTFELHVGGPTNLELALYAMLEEAEIKYIPEWTVPGSSYRVDAYDAVTKTAYEADGPTHHTRAGRKRDRQRDAWLLASGHVRKVVHLNAVELHPWM